MKTIIPLAAITTILLLTGCQKQSGSNMSSNDQSATNSNMAAGMETNSMMTNSSSMHGTMDSMVTNADTTNTNK